MKKSIVNDKSRTVIVVLLMMGSLYYHPLAIFSVILMWFWTKWAKWLKVLITLPFLLQLIISLFIFSNLFIAKPFQMSGNAMNPTYSNGEFLISRVMLKNKEFRRSNEIIFVYPQNESYFIGRIIGLPNEKILIEEGRVFINGKILDESEYLSKDVITEAGEFIPESEEVVISENQYFVMGDNRPESNDSRVRGLVKKDNITGKILFCYWNCSK